MYMLLHLASHVSLDSLRIQRPEVRSKRRSLPRQAATSEMLEKKEDLKEHQTPGDFSCDNCKMSFENNGVLSKHFEEIHELPVNNDNFVSKSV